jgi:IclR family transcriptional regulator, KDG regulon repressor
MPRVKTASAPADGILAVTLTFGIIQALAKSRVPLGVTELSNMVDATKSRVHRHLLNLSQAGYVARDARSEKYRIGPALIGLAQSIVAGIDVVMVARPALEELRNAFGHTALIAKREGDRIRVLDVALGSSDFAIVQHPGNVLALNTLHCSALGKVALAFGPADFMQEVLSRRLPKMTANTITEPRALIADLARVRTRGWASVPDEGMMGFNAVAVPIFDAQANLAAAIGVIGATRLLSATPLAALIDTIQRGAAAITQALGGRQPPLVATSEGPSLQRRPVRSVSRR